MNHIENGTVSETVIQVSRQYQTAVGQLNNMFQAAGMRTDSEAWREDKVGSCAKISDKKSSELGLDGPAGEYLIMLRDQRNQAAGGKSELTGCPYHRTDKGCILKDLKAPICIQYFDNPEEWRERFGINARQLREEIGDTLVAILNGYYLNSEMLLDEFRRLIDFETQKIKQEPVLPNRFGDGLQKS